MALTPEMIKYIDTLAAELKERQFRRLNKGANKFIGEFSGNLSQVEIDLPALTSAGFDSSKLPLYKSLFEVLVATIGDRRGLAPNEPEKKAYFDQQMEKLELDRKRLIIVCGHIAEKCGDRVIASNYRKIVQEGSGKIDKMTDTVALNSIVRKYLKLASEIRPGGMLIDETYCDEAYARAFELLTMCGVSVVQGIPQSDLVDRQNRIVTLCLNAQSEIKKFAAAAFFDNIEYYNSHYASDYPNTDSSEPTAS